MRNLHSEKLFEFFKVSGRMHLQLSRRAENVLPSGLTMAQFELLDLLKQAGSPLVPMALADEMQLTRGSLTNLIQQLEKKGLANLETNPNDGRSKLVSLSDKGGETHRRCLEALFELTTGIMKQFSQARIEPALEFAADMTRWLKENQ